MFMVQRAGVSQGTGQVAAHAGGSGVRGCAARIPREIARVVIDRIGGGLARPQSWRQRQTRSFSEFPDVINSAVPS